MANLQFFNLGKERADLERDVRAYEARGWRVIPAQSSLFRDDDYVGMVVAPRPGENHYDIGHIANLSRTPLRMWNAKDIQLRDAANLMNILYNLHGEEFFGEDVAQYVRVLKD